jgi:hypothetical protein
MRMPGQGAMSLSLWCHSEPHLRSRNIAGWEPTLGPRTSGLCAKPLVVSQGVMERPGHDPLTTLCNASERVMSLSVAPRVPVVLIFIERGAPLSAGARSVIRLHSPVRSHALTNAYLGRPKNKT